MREKMFNCLIRIFRHPSDDWADRLAFQHSTILLAVCALLAYHQTMGDLPLRCYQSESVRNGASGGGRMPNLEFVDAMCLSKPLRVLGGTKLTTLRAYWSPYIAYVLVALALLLALPRLFKDLLFRQFREVLRLESIWWQNDRDRRTESMARFIAERAFRARCCQTFQMLLGLYCLAKCSAVLLLYYALRTVWTMMPVVNSVRNHFQALWLVLREAPMAKGQESSEEECALNVLFPTRLVCQLPTRSDRPVYDYDCVFTLNTLLGPMSLVLTVWLTFVIVCQAFSVVDWAFFIICPAVRRRTVHSALTVSGALDQHPPVGPTAFLREMVNLETSFLLWYIRSAFGHLLMLDVVSRLYRNFVEKKRDSIPGGSKRISAHGDVPYSELFV